MYDIMKTPVQTGPTPIFLQLEFHYTAQWDATREYYSGKFNTISLQGLKEMKC